MFVNRAEELAALELWWERDSRPGLVWGRRRVGKTALMPHFAGARRTVWHTVDVNVPVGALRLEAAGTS